jgi:hypothetical protein
MNGTVGDARKRLTDNPPGADFPIQEIRTTAGRTALRAAATYLEDFPDMQAFRVWLLTYANQYQAGA